MLYRRVWFGPVSLVLSVAPLLWTAGCLPVASVMGRPAAVLPQGEEQYLRGGGGWYVDKQWLDDDPETPEVERDPEESHVALPYYHQSAALGLGRRMDVVGSHSNMQLMGVVRYQVLGTPLAAKARGRCPVDLSIEAGGTLTPYLFWPSFVILDTHVGASISRPTRHGTPYLGWRYHAGNYHAIDYTAFKNADGPWDTMLFFRQQVFYAGWAAERFTVEFHHGRPPSMDIVPEGRLLTYGVNVLFPY